MAAEIKTKLAKLEAAVDGNADLSSCATLLTQLKIGLTTLPGLQPGVSPTESTISDIALARDVYELASVLSVKQEDELAFERHVAQVKIYYVDYARVLTPSKRQNLVLGLNLMRLMAQNRIAEFHTELELVPSAARADKYIDYALRQEHYLMEGSYSKIREEKNAIPDPLYTLFVNNLMETVREEIAACSERAYSSLATNVAKNMLSIASDSELAAFCESRGWRIENSLVLFADKTDSGPSMEQVPSLELIKRSLEYARELEQII